MNNQRKVIDGSAALAKLFALVQAEMGYPRRARLASTGEYIDPPPGRPVEEAVGAILAEDDMFVANDGSVRIVVNDNTRAAIARVRARIRARVRDGTASDDERSLDGLTISEADPDSDSKWTRQPYLGRSKSDKEQA